MQVNGADIQEVCHRLVRTFMYDNRWSPQLVEHFHAWIADDRHHREKDIALRSVFDEIMEGTGILSKRCENE